MLAHVFTHSALIFFAVYKESPARKSLRGLVEFRLSEQLV